ncbi:MAG: DNA-binding transcriptional LysR family regulator [Myxococcota bacterium]|jgi:DNA-binding transcriptional LysR family regulator
MHNCIMKNWDDLRIFLASARTASSRGAARALGVNQSTVARRLKQLEVDSGVELFERRARGLELTDLGREVVVEAEKIEAAFAALDRLFLSRDMRPSGQIRFSVADGLLSLVGPVVLEMGRTHPNIQIEVEVNNGLANLSHLEADVVLRVAGSPPDALVGRRIATLVGAPYGSQDYLAMSTVKRLGQHHWIRWAEPWRGFAVEEWISANVPPAHVKAIINSNRALTALVEQGLGVGFLPCFAADADPRLVRLGPRVAFGASVWLLTHDDLRKTGRIAAFMKCVGEALLQKRQAIEGPFADGGPEGIVQPDGMAEYG